MQEHFRHLHDVLSGAAVECTACAVHAVSAAVQGTAHTYAETLQRQQNEIHGCSESSVDQLLLRAKRLRQWPPSAKQMQCQLQEYLRPVHDPLCSTAATSIADKLHAVLAFVQGTTATYAGASDTASAAIESY